MGKLDGKTAVITGATSGIGLATAQLMASEGAHVFITGRRAEPLAKARAEIGAAVTSVQGDISDLDDLDRLWEQVKQERGSVDIIVANAAFVEIAPLATATPEHFDTTFNTNARGTFFTVQKALPLLNDGGSIVLMSSNTRLVGLAPYATYSATKAAISSYARSWAAELKERRVRVNSITAGPIDTFTFENQAGSQEGAAAMREQMKSIHPLHRLGQAEEVAAAALFLASDDSSFITGSDLLVDGGQSQIASV